MKKIMMSGAFLLMIAATATAQNQNRTNRVQNQNVPVSPVQQGNSTDNNNRVLNNNNGERLNMNNKDMNNTQPGVNQPGNPVIGQPGQVPLHDNSNNNSPVIHANPVQSPPTIPVPPTNQQNPTPVNQQPVIR